MRSCHPFLLCLSPGVRNGKVQPPLLGFVRSNIGATNDAALARFHQDKHNPTSIPMDSPFLFMQVREATCIPFDVLDEYLNSVVKPLPPDRRAMLLRNFSNLHVAVVTVGCGWESKVSGRVETLRKHGNLIVGHLLVAGVQTDKHPPAGETVSLISDIYDCTAVGFLCRKMIGSYEATLRTPLRYTFPMSVGMETAAWWREYFTEVYNIDTAVDLGKLAKEHGLLAHGVAWDELYAEYLNYQAHGEFCMLSNEAHEAQ